MSGTNQTQFSTSGQPISSGQPMSVAVPGQPMVPASQPMIPAGQQPMMMAVPQQPVPVRYVAGPQGGMVYMPQPVNECILYVILIIYFVSRLRWPPNQLIVVFFQIII